ncbi:unnamed protein product [Cunninghamella blakesleeana]
MYVLSTSKVKVDTLKQRKLIKKQPITRKLASKEKKPKLKTETPETKRNNDLMFPEDLNLS